MSKVEKVCIIGAGPSGMSLLGNLKKFRKEGVELRVTCYEKQERPGGLWNFSWRTGLDQWGENVHCSQYQDLFSNGPKECLEIPEYTFAQHFGREIPSFPPRPVMEDYLRGYWKFLGVKEDVDVLTSHCVRNVTFDEDQKKFEVKVTDLVENAELNETFDYLVVATGHFSVPNVPEFPGMRQFPGRILHSHDFRSAKEFTGKDVLVVGSSYSAEDIALQCYKFGAKSVTISFRTAAMGFEWPENITELPLVTRIEGKTCFFKDGSERSVDAIVLCTGYKHHFPFMPAELRLKTANIYNLPNLYRDLQWLGTTEGTGDCDGRLFYLGMQDQFYTFTMFMIQGMWVANVICGKLELPSVAERKAEIKSWFERNDDLDDCYKQIEAQTDYVKRLAAEINYGADLDVADLFVEWEHDKHVDILTYRDKSFTSKFSKNKAPVHELPWIENFDDSLENFVEKMKITE